MSIADGRPSGRVVFIYTNEVRHYRREDIGVCLRGPNRVYLVADPFTNVDENYADCNIACGSDDITQEMYHSIAFEDGDVIWDCRQGQWTRTPDREIR